jgi:hypothetical protein
MSGETAGVSSGRRPTARRPDDAGQITLLTIAFAMLALLLVTAVVSATGIHLERKRLLALSDALALEAADGVGPGVVYGNGMGNRDAGGVIQLTDRDVSRAVAGYLVDNPDAATGFVDLAVESGASPDGRTAEVHLTALARPTLISWVTAPWSDGVELQVRSSARAW